MIYVLAANAMIAILYDEPGVALARRVDGELVTSDHHELEPLAQAGVCKINFFR